MEESRIAAMSLCGLMHQNDTEQTESGHRHQACFSNRKYLHLYPPLVGWKTQRGWVAQHITNNRIVHDTHEGAKLPQKMWVFVGSILGLCSHFE